MSMAITAGEARERVKEGEAMLVCAYDDADKCRKLGIDESIPMSDFQSRLGDVSKMRDIVFFCA